MTGRTSYEMPNILMMLFKPGNEISAGERASSENIRTQENKLYLLALEKWLGKTHTMLFNDFFYRS